MNILAVGDVCGSIGCKMLFDTLPKLKKEYGIDLTIVNGENSADGNGITPESAEKLFHAGADIITGGNHSLRRKEVYALLDENPYVLRPENLPGEYGHGYCLYDLGKTSLAVISISGKVFLEKSGASSPFEAADRLIEKANADGAKMILVDFHAEATSEKKALGFYLDGRVTAVFGTHTHVLTADAEISPSGTAYITDIGMTGPRDSVLGVKKEIIISRLKDGAQDKFVLADGECMLNGCLFGVNELTGKAENVKLINI